MGKVVRLSVYTEDLMKRYSGIIRKEMEKYKLDYDTLMRSDDQIIQAALLYTIRHKEGCED